MLLFMYLCQCLW